MTADLARDLARKAETEIAAGRWRGPFHGVPIGLKDLCYTKGILTTGGSKILGKFVPDHDSTVWARLSEAGAVLLGKLNLHEFAYGATSNNPHWGTCRNPYDLERIPGGSSGGFGRGDRGAHRRRDHRHRYRRIRSASPPRVADASASSRPGAG